MLRGSPREVYRRLLADSHEARTVCLVDDDPLLRRALQRLLRATGFTVEAFASAEDFLASERVPLFNCLVLDVRLGSACGFDVYDRLRASGVSIPTVFITGHDDAAARERARKTGAAGYVPQPFEDSALLSAIEMALDRPR
jgi:FixJ family two-component response regulator